MVAAAHAGYVLHQLLPGLDVILCRNGYLFHNRRAAAVVRAYIVYSAGGRAEHVAQKPPELRLVLRRHVRVPLGVLEERFTGFRVLEILFMGEGGHNTAGDVAEDFRLAPHRFARQAPAHVTVNRIRNIGAGAVRHEAHAGHVDFRFAEIRGRVSRGVAQFRGHDELGQFFPHVGLFMNVVHLRGEGRHSHDDVADGRLASRIGMAVEQGEKEGEHAAVLVFSGKKDPFPRDEAVFKNHIGIGRAGHEAAFIVLPRPEVMDGDDLFQSVPVAGNGEGHRVIPVLRSQRPGRQHQHLFRNRGFGNVHLAALDDDPVLQPLLDPHVRAGVRLVCWPEQPVALHVGLGAAPDHVLVLKATQPFFEILMILRRPLVHLVRFIGHVVNGVCPVAAHAPLNAAADLLAEHARHVLLPVQVFSALMDMGEAVDPFTAEMRDGG